jgi:hypothetical protein
MRVLKSAMARRSARRVDLALSAVNTVAQVLCAVLAILAARGCH